MIKEYEYLHGVVFTRLCTQGSCNVSIRSFKQKGYSSFSVNGKAGLYIKYSGKRLTPWRFTLAKSHQEEIEELFGVFGEVFIALVCYLDGVVVLDYNEYKSILDEIYEDFEWISVSRPKNKMYSVCASNGKLSYKIALNSCPNKIIEYISRS